MKKITILQAGVARGNRVEALAFSSIATGVKEIKVTR